MSMKHTVALALGVALLAASPAYPQGISYAPSLVVDTSEFATQSALSAMAATIPVAGTGSPTAPVDTLTGTAGTAGQYAPFAHTHPSKVRKERMQSAADGTLVWTYTAPFDTGVVPRCQAIAEVTFGTADVVNAQVDGTPTNTQLKVRVTRTQKSVVALIGLTILSIPASTGATWVHMQCSEP